MTIAIILLSYLLGSIPGAILICKLLNLPDPRYYGSKNPGSINTLRISGYKSAISVMLFDILKGFVPIWIGSLLQFPPILLKISSICICIGHIYPIFFKFHGGKGVATALGILLSIDPNLAIIMIGIWMIVVLISGYASLGSIITAIIIPIYTWKINPQNFFFIICISCLILIRHIDNIKRIWTHQEKNIWNH